MSKWEFGGRLLIGAAATAFVWLVWTTHGEEAGRWLAVGYMLALFVGMFSKH